MSNLKKKAVYEEAAVNEPRVFVYVGPSIKGRITNGSIFKGTRKTVLAQLKSVIDKCPKIERFIVADRDVSETKKKIKEGNNGWSAAYRELLSDLQGGIKNA
ncbi:MAG: hypothetical protein J1F28_04565 [Oscillospiraceae bacterium]|nr:hypothetical protein [Oscillospiraceae bacterium]